MPRDFAPPTIQRQFLEAALKEGVRLDGRKLLDARKVEITFGRSSASAKGKGKERDVGGLDELGEVTVTMGKTKVLAQVSASLVAPLASRPFEGILLINSEISPMASASYEAGRQSDDEVVLGRLLEKAIRRSEAVDREALCVVAGEKVWQIRLTLHYLADDGNLLDCACLAGMTALRHYRKPEVEVLGEEIIIHKPDERAPVPLSIHHTPICVTFAYFQGNILVIDPTHEESTLSTGTMTVTLNAQRELCVLSKAGGSPLSVDELMRLVKLGAERVKELVRQLEDGLKADWEVRRKVIEVQ